MNDIDERIKADRLVDIVTAAEQIRSLCSIVTKVARSDLEAHLKQFDAGITGIEHGLLRHLSHGVTSMAEISRLMGIAPSTLVYVVDGLTKKRLVRKGKDSRDRRRQPLLLERKGVELFAQTPKIDDSSSLVKSLERMPVSSRRQLLSLLNELVGAFIGPNRFYLDAASKEAKGSSSSRRSRRKDEETRP